LLMSSSCIPGCSGCQTNPPVVSQHGTEQETVSKPVLEKEHHEIEPSTAEATIEKSARDDAESPVDSEPSSVVQAAPPKSGREPTDKTSDGTEHSNQSSAPPGDAEGAFKKAVALRDKARRASERKQYGNAFELASQAWETARAYPQDAKLKQFTEELSSELEKFGQQANAKYNDRIKGTSTILIEK